MGFLDECAKVANERWQQYEAPAPITGLAHIVVSGQVFKIGPGGLGTEDPDESDWCTRDPDTCEMVVLPCGTTKARMKNGGRLCNHPPGTCMLWPARGACKYIGGREG